jgi:L-ascorbate metabolism protein UlaG (beta-lactamase superfamily)
MPSDITDKIRELYSIELGSRDLSFIFFGYSGIICRSKYGVVAIDLGDEYEDSKVNAIENLDLLLITHTHWDHFNRKTAIKIVEKTGATIVAEPNVANELEGRIPSDKLLVGEPGKKRQTKFKINNIDVTAIMGVHPRPITVYKIVWDGPSIFHGGDSGYMQVGSQKVDVAFLPVGLPSPTCTPEIALAMTKWLKPKIVIPMHGKAKQMTEFAKLVGEARPRTKVVIPEPFEPVLLSL